MSKIGELINKYCPDGIDFFPLYQLVFFDKRFNGVDKKKQPVVLSFKHVSAEKLKSFASCGDIKLLATGKFDGYTNAETAGAFVNEGEVITIPSGGNANIKYFKGKFVDGGNILLSSRDPKRFSLKFIYHYLLYKNDFIQSCFRGGSVQHPEMPKIIELLIPLPPIQIQDEIVRLLDLYTELTSNLIAELRNETILRSKQREFYKQHVFDSLDSYPSCHITDIALIKARVGWQRLTKAEYQKSGDYYLITGTDFNGGSIDFSTCVFVSKERYEMDPNIIVHKDDVLITKDGTLGKVAFLREEPNKPTTLNSGVFRIKADVSKVYPRYLYHYFTSKKFTDFVESVKTGSTIPHLTQEGLLTLNIPLPPIRQQKEISDLLDSLEFSFDNLLKVLPEEISFREKQYCYYRDQLLDFKE